VLVAAGMAANDWAASGSARDAARKIVSPMIFLSVSFGERYMRFRLNSLMRPGRRLVVGRGAAPDAEVEIFQVDAEIGGSSLFLTKLRMIRVISSPSSSAPGF
jgi:hypothetical protein